MRRLDRRDGWRRVGGSRIGGARIGPGNGTRALLEGAVPCNDADPGAGDTEGALVAAALAAGIDVGAVRREFPRTRTVPFDSARR